MGIAHTTFFDVAPDPTLACAKTGADADDAPSSPDCIIAIGGGSAMDAGKIMWVLLRAPRGVISWTWPCDSWTSASGSTPSPRWGKRPYFIAIPTSAGTGSEVTPFAVITDERYRRQVPPGGL